MQNKAILLITLLIASGSVLAEQDVIGNADKQLLKEAATAAVPKEAVKAAEGVAATGQTLENAEKLKEAAPDALKNQAQDMAKESAKQKLNEAVPEKAKHGMKSVEKSAKTAKNLKGKLPKSTGEAAETVKGKAKTEAANKVLDTLK
jgi:hypothetical protein